MICQDYDFMQGLQTLFLNDNFQVSRMRIITTRILAILMQSPGGSPGRVSKRVLRLLILPYLVCPVHTSTMTVSIDNSWKFTFRVICKGQKHLPRICWRSMAISMAMSKSGHVQIYIIRWVVFLAVKGDENGSSDFNPLSWWCDHRLQHSDDPLTQISDDPNSDPHISANPPLLFSTHPISVNTSFGSISHKLVQRFPTNTAFKVTYMFEHFKK